MLTFICYPKCSTCQKAKALLDSYNVEYETRDIKENNPTYDELKAWLAISKLPVRNFFNTSGQLYKSLGLKDKLPKMSEDECLQLLATDGMIVKRPLLIDEYRALAGFNHDEWNNELTLRISEKNKLGNRVTLRLEKKSDYKTVEQITYRAFLTAEHADGDEALLSHKLRSCPAFVPELDYVAELDGKVIGNILYTRSKVVGDVGEWETLTFGPISVLPKYQRDGVGSALIRKTLDVVRELGCRAVIIFGHESYYPRFGFKPADEYGITTADGKNFPAFMALPLYDGALDGVHGHFVLDPIFENLDRAESDAMNKKLAAPMDVDEYIEARPLYFQSFLSKVRSTIHAAAPDALEKISYQMPTFRDGRNLIHFAAFKQHIGVYPGAEAIAHFTPRLRKYKTSKGAIQFPYQGFGDEQLALIHEIAAWTARQT